MCGVLRGSAVSLSGSPEIPSVHTYIQQSRNVKLTARFMFESGLRLMHREASTAHVALCFSLGEEDKLTLTGLPLLLPSQLAHRPGEGWSCGRCPQRHLSSTPHCWRVGQSAHPLLSSAPEGSNVWLGEPSGFLEKQGLPQPRDREQSRAPGAGGACGNCTV